MIQTGGRREVKIIPLEQNSLESDEPNLNVKLQFIQVLTNFERGEQVGLISELSLETVWISTKGLIRDILVEEWNEGNEINNVAAACGLERVSLLARSS